MLIERFTSLGSYKPWERRRLLDLACLRNTLVALLVLWLASVRVTQGWPVWLITMLAPCDACLMALVSADFVEHFFKRLLLGYSYNPNVMAMGELEGSMTPMSAEYAERWEREKFTPVAFWHGDPGSGRYERPWWLDRG